MFDSSSKARRLFYSGRYVNGNKCILSCNADLMQSSDQIVAVTIDVLLTVTCGCYSKMTVIPLTDPRVICSNIVPLLQST
jgi:hypothetical protein